MLRFRNNKQIIYVFLATILVLFTMFPYYWMVTQSFAPAKIVDHTFFNTRPSLEHFKYLMNNGGDQNRFMWLRALFNSIFVTLTVSVLAVSFSMLVGYSISKLKYKGHKVVFNFLLFQMFFPGIILLIPQFLIMKSFANTYFAMIVPTSMNLWGIFMIINYFKTVPEAIFEAARIDGASELKILFRIGLPAARTIGIIVFLTVFMGRWTELMWDMLISPKVQMQTLNVMITTVFKPMGNLPGPLYAASVFLTFPTVLLCILFSKYFREGLSFQLK